MLKLQENCPSQLIYIHLNLHVCQINFQLCLWLHAIETPPMESKLHTSNLLRGGFIGLLFIYSRSIYEVSSFQQSPELIAEVGG